MLSSISYGIAVSRYSLSFDNYAGNSAITKPLRIALARPAVFCCLYAFHCMCDRPAYKCWDDCLQLERSDLVSRLRCHLN